MRGGEALTPRPPLPKLGEGEAEEFFIWIFDPNLTPNPLLELGEGGPEGRVRASSAYTNARCGNAPDSTALDLHPSQLSRSVA
ncbi:hypothetical protein CCAX7_31530 [Capsulimonas corticalis]|uniref:Uncharacterized protein n=1 Tax=Capsulimonas corticalis TaxID=2219043 RepID=A0A402CSF6_9BACT|nr:hypothetical protein CCAX7_31530 [Capsulimonas corticalis]